MSNPPTMETFRELKSRFPDTILVFCVGDFCEILNEDATEAARLLDLPLETHVDGPESCRFVRFQLRNLKTHLANIVANGRKAAVCEPLPWGRKGEAP